MQNFGSTVLKTVPIYNFWCVGDPNCHLSHSFKVFMVIEGEFVCMRIKFCKNSCNSGVLKLNALKLRKVL